MQLHLQQTRQQHRAPRRCPGCRTAHCAVSAILCRRCWRSVPPEISQWLARADTHAARIAAVRMILTWTGENLAAAPKS